MNRTEHDPAAYSVDTLNQLMDNIDGVELAKTHEDAAIDRARHVLSAADVDVEAVADFDGVIGDLNQKVIALDETYVSREVAEPSPTDTLSEIAPDDINTIEERAEETEQETIQTTIAASLGEMLVRLVRPEIPEDVRPEDLELAA